MPCFFQLVLGHGRVKQVMPDLWPDHNDAA